MLRLERTISKELVIRLRDDFFVFNSFILGQLQKHHRGESEASKKEIYCCRNGINDFNNFVR